MTKPLLHVRLLDAADAIEEYEASVPPLPAGSFPLYTPGTLRSAANHLKAEHEQKVADTTLIEKMAIAIHQALGISANWEDYDFTHAGRTYQESKRKLARAALKVAREAGVS